MIVHTKTFVPYKQFHHDIIRNFTAAIFDLNLADLNCHTNLAYRKQVIKLYLMYIVLTYIEVTKSQNISHCNTCKSGH